MPVTNVTAWIPDTLRSFHSLTRSGTTEAGVLPQISNPIGWQTRCLATSQH
ncbi:protein of unknown function [Aminobacter niigataensis]|nr:protein of unknown function [Aminobacter niigataensis]